MKYIKEYKYIDWEDFDEDEGDDIPEGFSVNKETELFYKFLVDRGILDQWIKNIDKIKPEKKRMYTNQIDWIKNTNNEIVIDVIGKFENISEDWEFICNKLNINAKLPHYNKTIHKDYKTYYKKPDGSLDLDAIDKVAKLHNKDITFFDYKF